MVSNDDFFAGRKPAAVLKHAVFTSYAYPYFTMVGRWHKGPMWLIDGYAGPGKYEADASGRQINGSPVMALLLARKQRAFQQPRDVRCAFIEANKTYYDELVENVRPFQQEGLYADLYCGSVAKELPAAWSKVGDNPVLTLIDPFGISAVSKELMTDVLLTKDRKSSSEVLVNISVEAVSRHGGCLQWGPGGQPELKPAVKHDHGVVLSDTFFGGGWWRERFLQERDRHGDANTAAKEVIDEYRAMIHAETGAASLVVPIRRTPTGPVLFHFTLFYRHPAGAYKFADAAAKATATWRDVFRKQDLEQALAREQIQPSLWGGEQIQEFTAQDAQEREDQLKADAVAHIETNMRRLVQPLGPGQGIPVASNVDDLLGEFMSLAEQPAIIRAWDRLAQARVVQPRDRSRTKDMWKLHIVKQ